MSFKIFIVISTAIQEYAQMNKDLAKNYLVSALIGIAGSALVFIFFRGIEEIQEFRPFLPFFVTLLPFAGLLIGNIIERYALSFKSQGAIVFTEVHTPQKTVPTGIVPYIIGLSWISHLFGASVGREGAAIQISASFGDFIRHRFKISILERKHLLLAGIAAGFCAALNTPIAAAIFGMEVAHVRKWEWKAFGECSVASLFAFLTAKFLPFHHNHFFPFPSLPISPQIIEAIGVSSIVFGLAARVFSFSLHKCEDFFQRFFKRTYWQMFVGGLIIAVYSSMEATFRFNGLGIDHIYSMLNTHQTLDVPFHKFALTIISVGSGFRGGEFVPLVFIGSTLGAAMASFFNIPALTLSTLGFGAVFAAASNTPVACSIMLVELFGISILPWALISCFIAYSISGHQGIYKGQKHSAGGI